MGSLDTAVHAANSLDPGGFLPLITRRMYGDRKLPVFFLEYSEVQESAF